MKDTSKKALRRGHNEGNIRQRTDGRWEVRLSAGIDYKTGKPRRTSTCCNTRQEAIAILQQQAHEVRTQGWRDPMSVTLGEWYEYWLDTYMKDTVKQSTYASYRSYLNKHFCVLGKILLKKLEPHTLQEFYNYKFREEGLSPKTLRNYHMALHKCLQQAVKERLLVYNPCDAVTLPSGEKPEISVFTNDQQRALVQASYRHRYGVFIRLDLCTGLRMGELLALKWEDIDFERKWIHVHSTIEKDKNGVWYAAVNAPQRGTGYNDFYDFTFQVCNYTRFEAFFTASTKAGVPKEWRIEGWKGNYLNMGIGGEIGLYYRSINTVDHTVSLFFSIFYDISNELRSTDFP